MQKIIDEIDNMAANWDSTKKGSMKLPGQDIQVNDVEMFQKLLHLNDFRNFLINDTNFRCRQCPLFREHLLRRLNYIDDSNLVSLKGRVACEIHHQV
ncbi:unnamed protein product [Onchocerca flexuosa]|uniref:Uncharacterized protein n=1 Tax=Onchocerca flexuosa TaxID=387005 RepID=A0A183I8N7_9BILA|nr:unnamed protein product [Onchocerca flexuosa]